MHIWPVSGRQSATMRFPADGARYGEKFGTAGGRYPEIHRSLPPGIAYGSPLPTPRRFRYAARNRADLTCHQNPIRHGGVFHALLFRGSQPMRGLSPDHGSTMVLQAVDRSPQTVDVAGFPPRLSCDLLRNAERIFPATLATDNCWSLLLPRR